MSDAEFGDLLGELLVPMIVSGLILVVLRQVPGAFRRRAWLPMIGWLLALFVLSSVRIPLQENRFTAPADIILLLAGVVLTYLIFYRERGPKRTEQVTRETIH